MPPAKREDPLPTPEAREAFIELLQQEAWLQAILAKIEKPRYKVDRSVIGELQEISGEHALAYRNGEARLPVVRTRSDLLKLQEANSLCLAHRDRVTEITVSYLAIKHALDALWDLAEERLQGYAAFKALSNERARALFVLAVLRPIADKRAHASQVLKMAETVKESLTHTHFAIRQQADMGISMLAEKSS